MASTSPTSTNPTAFPLGMACAALTGAALATALVEAVLLLSIPAWKEAAPAVAFAGTTTWLAALAGLTPVALLGRYGVSATISAYFSGMAARVLVCIVAGTIGVYALDLASQPLLLGMAGMYMPLLFVEAAIVGRYLARKDSSPPASAGHKEVMA